MPQCDKSEVTDKQTREANHIAAKYTASSTPQMEPKARVRAKVIDVDGGGERPDGSFAHWPSRRPPRRRSPGERVGRQECEGTDGRHGNGRNSTLATHTNRSGVMT